MANHASHAALPYPVKGARFTVLVPLLDADGDPTAQTTPDTEISEDNGAATDAAEEVSATSGMDGMGMITFTGAETDCSTLAVNFKAASGPKATLMTLYPRVLPTLESGTAQAGANGSITLAANAAAYDLAGCIVKTTGGTGGGGTGGANNQARVITAYNTSTKVATVVPNWETNPSSDTTYDVLLTEVGVNAVVGRFLRPTTDGRTLDVATTGEAGLDFNNVLSSSLVTLHSLTISGATTLSGAVSLGSTLGVTGTTTLAAVTTTGTVTFNAFTVSNATTLSGAVSLGSTLGVTGTTTLAAVTTTGTVTFNAFTVSNATTLSGAVSLGSTLGVTGTTTLAALTTTGTVTFNALTVSGATSLAAVSTSGTVTFNAFTVSGATTLTGAVAATNASNDIVGIDVAKIKGSATAATNQKNAATVVYSGTATSNGTTTTLIDTSLTQVNDHWNGRVVIFLTGTLAFQAASITDFDAATDTLTISAVTSAPQSGDTYVIV